MRSEPWLEEAAYTLQKDQEEREWEETLPKCAICGKPIKDDYCIDLSEGYTECLVHKDCVRLGLTGSNCDLSEEIRQDIWNIVEEHCSFPAWK